MDQPRHLRRLHKARVLRRPTWQLVRVRRPLMLAQVRPDHRLPDLLLDAAWWYPAVGAVGVVQVLVTSIEPAHPPIVPNRSKGV